MSGPIHLPSPVTEDTNVIFRVHWLDNLRATLTALLIFHHAAIEASNASSPKTSIPLSLFVAINKTFLWGLFFFVSGYASSMSISFKSDGRFLLYKIARLLLPGLFYGFVGGVMLFLFLASGWGHVFGSWKANWAAIRFSGPVNYVLLLFLFDAIYVFVRWVRRRWHVPSCDTTARRTHLTVGILLATLTVYTFLIATMTLPQSLAQSGLLINYDTLHPYMPVQFVLAYVAGIYFSSIGDYMFLPQKYALVALLASLLTSYGFMGLAMTMSSSLRDFVILDGPYSEPRRFVDGGFNIHTLFYALWSTVSFFTISTSIVSVYANFARMTREWGVWTRHTYIQTYIHMVPLLVVIYWLQGLSIVVLKAFLVGLGAVLASWTVVMLPWILVHVLGP